VSLEIKRWLGAQLGFEDFEYPASHRLLEVGGRAPDLVLCHNLHGRYFDLRILPWLSRRVPVVLSLADSWPFTGHCACPPGCSRWEIGCGSCPDLDTPLPVKRDATRANWHRKRRIYSRSRVFVTSPSRWLSERARRSILATGAVEWSVLPHGVDTELFSPGPRNATRRELGLELQGTVLLYVAHGGSRNPFKDFATLREALRLLGASAPRAPDQPVDLVVVGREAPAERVGEGVRIRHLPACRSDQRLRDLYRAADLYVHAAGEEAFGLVALEAQACGTPVVAAAGGGFPEVVEHGRTGWLTPPGDPVQLARALGRVLADSALRERMGVAGAQLVRSRFDRRRTVAALHGWCEEVLVRWRQSSAGSVRTG
jgi:glycosyltransferase involved in cell wall biosynthesis